MNVYSKILASVMCVFFLLSSCGSDDENKFNRAPVISSIKISNNILHIDQKETITVNAYDPDNDDIECKYEFIIGSGNIEAHDNYAIVSINNFGINAIKVTVTDGNGGEATGTINLMTGNQSPVIYLIKPQSDIIDKNASVIFDTIAADPDGDKLTYSFDILSGDGSVSNVLDTSQGIYTAANLGGEKIVRVKVSDGFGGVSTKTAAIYVNKDWMQIGSSLDGNASYDYALKTDNNNQLYITYKTTSNETCVKRLDGANWIDLSAPSYPSSFGRVDMLFDSINNLYVAMNDKNVSNMFVIKYNGSSWETLTTNGFDSKIGDFVGIQLDSSDQLFTGFSDATTNYKATVMKFNGSDWVYVGDKGFSTYGGVYGFVIDNNDVPNMLCYDYDVWWISRMAFNGTNWIREEIGMLHRNNLTGSSYACSPDNVYYVAYIGSYVDIRYYYNNVRHIDESSSSYKQTQMGFDNKGLLNIIYKTGTNYGYSTYNRETGAIVKMSPGNFANGKCLKMAIDKNNDIYISYFDRDDGDKLKVFMYR